MTFFGPDIRNGLPIGLGSMAGFGRRAFTPSVLFAAGEAGVWYDPSDIPVNWRRNLLTYSEQFDNAVWNRVGAGTGSAPTVTPNDATAPDGTLTADLIVFNRGAGNTLSDQSDVVQTLGAAVPAVSYTFSVWMKAATGGDVGKQLALRTVAGSGYGVITLTADWVRYSRTEIGATSNGGEINTRGTVTVENSVSAHVWGAQLERGSVATDYQRIVTPEISFLDYQPQPVMYTDSAGTTPVTAVEQAVGLSLDKSRGLRLGPELVTNGDFSSGTTGWSAVSGGSISVSGGVATFSSSPTLQQTAEQVITTVANRWYQFTVDVISLSAGSQSFSVGTSSGGNQLFSSFLSTLGKRTGYFLATSTTTYVGWFCGAASRSANIDNISVRELAGTHRIQPTAASRPILRARYNDLLMTPMTSLAGSAGAEYPNATGWSSFFATSGTRTYVDSSVLSGQKALDIASVSAGRNVIAFTFTPRASSSYTVSFNIESVSGVTGTVAYTEGTLGAGGTSNVIGAPTTTGRVSYTFTTGTGSGAVNVRFGIGAAGNESGSMRISGFDVRLTADAYLPSYQRVTSATDYDTAGFPTYLEYDGSDDSLYTGGNLDLSGTDKVTVFAGVTKLGTADGMLLETSADAGANSGAFYLGGPLASGSWQYAGLSRGTANGVATVTAGFASPVTNVIAISADIAGDSTVLRLNGSQAASASTDQGTGNYGSYPLYMGRRNNATLPFNGREYGLIVRGAATSDALIQQAERWMAAKQGRTL